VAGIRSSFIYKMILIAGVVALLLFAFGACAQESGYVSGLAELPNFTGDLSGIAYSGKHVTILLDGIPLPTDASSGICYVPQTLEDDAFDGRITVLEEAGYSYSVYVPDGFNKENALLNGLSLKVIGQGTADTASTTVVFTPMPVIAIETADGNLPGEEDCAAEMRVFSAEYRRIWLDETPIEINVRGNTSTRFPKKSYRVKVVDDSGEKDNLSIGGLRNDDDWILNPMYTDTSKVREGLAYSLWEDINLSGGKAKSSGFAYCEVILNSEYWGLYLLQERIDRKQVDVNKRSGVLYKVVVNDPPAVESLINCRDAAYCEGIELEFAGAGLDKPWTPAAGYVAWLVGEDAIPLVEISEENFIDYGLFAMLTQAYDCHFKNQFLHGVYERSRHVVYRIPWDLNNTFGDVWENDAQDTNYTEYRVLSPMIDPAFEKIINSADAKTIRRIQNRWAELRRGPVQEENILARAQDMHRRIFAAIERDSVRWPECGLGEGNAVNILDIRQFVEEMIPEMDLFISQLASKENQTGR